MSAAVHETSQEPEGDPVTPPRRFGHSLLELVELVVGLAVLSLILRFYVFETFVIPTGSMAPTLLGHHHRVQNPSTGRELKVDRVRGGDFSVIDTRTGERIPVAAMTRGLPLEGGDRIAVDKLSYRIGDPERWDVLVFKFPMDPTRNFIKRVVGLPGERLAIQHGDILIDGARVVKPEPVQDVLWFCVYDQAWPGAADAPSLWRPKASHARRWSGSDSSTLTATSDAFVANAGPTPTRLTYRRRIEDYYDYNPLSRLDKASTGSGERLAGDLRLELNVTASRGSGAVRLGLDENGQSLLLTLPVAGGSSEAAEAAEARVERVGDGPLGPLSKVIPGWALQPGVKTRIRLSWHDRRLIVAVDGVERLCFDDPSGKSMLLRSGAWLEAPEQGARFEEVRLSRDIVYFVSEFRGAGITLVDGAVQLPDDGYFMLGDNAPNSSDSRVWGVARRGHVVGRAAFVYWPPGERRFIR